jgi:hypothetical protein
MLDSPFACEAIKLGSIADGTISLLREVLFGSAFRFFFLTAVFLNFNPAYPQSPSQSCKSTVTGDLEIVSLTSKIYGNTQPPHLAPTRVP